MIDLSKYDRHVIMARGEYSIVRRAREDAIKKLQGICDSQMGAIAAVLRDVQKDGDVERHMAFLRDGQSQVAELVEEISALNTQLGLIKPLAFPND